MKEYAIIAAAAAGVLSGVVPPRSAAQTTLNSPAFEVASIKTNQSGGRGGMRPQPSGLAVTNLNLKFLIQDAYSVEDFQITGGPGWVENDRYDITAKANGPITNEQRKGMLQSLLADRFHLKIHRETKEFPVYALVAGKSGPKLRDADATKPPQIFMQPTAAGLRLVAQKSSMQALANLLSLLMHRTVLDHSGIQGEYDFTAEWVPDETQPGGTQLKQNSQDPGHAAEPTENAGGTSIFAALQEQLGLRLESTRGPVEILIIDHAERPTEN